MPAGSIALDSAAVNRSLQSVSPKSIDKERRFSSNRPITVVRERIWRDWLRGVTERSLSIMYELTRETVEEVVREQARLMARAAATAAARTACLLIALVSYDSWTTAIRDDAAAIERSFRNGRARKRGLEDGLMLIELRAQANSGAA